MTLAISRSENLAARAAPVPLSASLARQIEGDHMVGDFLVKVTAPPSRMDVAEARDKIGEAEQSCRKADPRSIAAWCRRLEGLPWGPDSPEKSQIMITAIVMACGDLPAAVWTAETETSALQKFKRWPAPAEVFELLTPYAAKFTSVRDGLRRVIAGTTPGQDTTDPADRSSAAQEAVRGVVAAFVGERSFNKPGDLPAHTEVKPAFLSEGQLAIARQQAGITINAAPMTRTTRGTP